MAKKKNEIDENGEEKKNDSRSILGNFLKDNKEDHLNFEPQSNYKVSTGSLLFDMELDGGFGPGIVRMSGVSEGGKTSATLSALGNHLRTVPNSKGLIIKAEGRLSLDMISRYDYKFVYTAEEWVIGTVFVFETNVYETAISLLRQLVKNNEEKIKYFFVIDSMDALCKKEDVDKDFNESDKVAGSALLTSVFLKKMALAMGRLGHICVLISQVRSTVSINPYAKVDPKLTNGSGGSALYHYSDVILEFQQRFNADMITETKGGVEKNIGHYCKVIFRKSSNEKTGTLVKYPIKYGRKLGKSVWLEREVFEMLLAWGLITKKAAWFILSKTLIDRAKDFIDGYDPVLTKEISFHGEEKFMNWLESKPELVKLLVEDFKQKISG